MEFLEIEETDLANLKLIANGASGEVLVGKHKTLGQVAVKKIFIAGSEEKKEEVVKKFRKEVKVLKTLQHKNIIKIHGTVAFQDRSFGIVMECGDGGNLEDFLHLKSVNIKLPQKIKILRQMADALQYMHENDTPVVHGDLKPQNILLMSDGCVKLSDFGASNVLKDHAGTTLDHPSFGHTVPYTAPELLRDSTIKRSTMEDVYGFAMISYEVLTEEVVYFGARPHLLKNHILDGGRPRKSNLTSLVDKSKISSETSVYKKLIKMIQECWNDEPKARPTMSSVKSNLDGFMQELFPIEKQKILEDVTCNFTLNRLPSVLQNENKNFTTIGPRKRSTSTVTQHTGSKNSKVLTDHNASCDLTTMQGNHDKNESHKLKSSVQIQHFPSNNSEESADAGGDISSELRNCLSLNLDKIKVGNPEVEKLKICPKLYTIPNYYDGVDIEKFVFPTYQPSSQTFDENQIFNEEIKFIDLFMEAKAHRYIAIIGPPGAGKTTCSIRLARFGDEVYFYFQFREMNYPDKITLKYFLIDIQLGDWPDEKRKKAYEWVISNQQKCVIIIDGYDQAVLKLETSPKYHHETPMPIQHLVAGLCCGNLLPSAKVIITSRPHAINPLRHDLRPRLVIFIQDLHPEDIKTLFHSFSPASSPNQEEVWKGLEMHSPQLLNLCHNVLMLQFTVKAAFGDRSNKFQRVCTMTDMFMKLLQQFCRSHHSGDRVDEKLISRVSLLAYKKTKEQSVVITKDDIKKNDLDEVCVQDLIITILGDAEESLFEGDKVLFFVHQTWQEVLAACYCCFHMSLQEFCDVVENVVTDPNWAMVRRFVYGLLLGSGKFIGTKIPDLNNKRKSLITKMKRSYTQCVQGNDVTQLLEIFVDLLECNKEHVKLFSNLFPKNVDFHNQNMGASAFYALSTILELTEIQIQYLGLRNTYPSVSSLERLYRSMTEMKQMIRVLDLSFNKLTDDHIPVLVKIIPYVSDRLLLRGAFTDPLYGGMCQPNPEQQLVLSNARNKYNKNLKMEKYTGGTF